MKHQSVVNELHFEAAIASGHQQEYDEDVIVHGIFFEESDPETGGQHWNFTRSLGDEDDGVCTVKEIQQVTVYEGITKFELTRRSLLCEFDELTSKSTGVSRLKIAFRVDHSTWSLIARQAYLVFTEKPYFTIADAQP